MSHTRLAYQEAREVYTCALCGNNIPIGEHYYWIRHREGRKIDIYHVCKKHFGHPDPAEIFKKLGF